MLDTGDPDPFYKIYSKVGIKNTTVGVKLNKYLKVLDNERQVSEVDRNNEIFEEKLIAHQLKQTADNLKRTNTIEKPLAVPKQDYERTMSLMTTIRSHSSGDSLDQSRDSICVSGYRLSSGDVKPRMFFWSQDASTKLPTPTAFYGYELGLQRPLTEVKLLGQDVYQGTKYRATQSADPRSLRETFPPLRNVHTSMYPRVVDGEILLERSKTDIQTHHETKPVVNLAKTKHFAKIYDLKFETTKKCDPEELNLNLKRYSESQENLASDQNKTAPKSTGLWPGDPKAIDSVRRPRRRIAEMLRNFKTREEARRCYREMLLRTPCSRNCQVPKVVTELENSYNDIPVLAGEANRLKYDVERDPTLDGKQYAKSTFGVNMQTSISKKVLNKKALPVAFRKCNNTFLKHYGGPIMEMKTPRHYNTPDIFIETV